MDVTTTFLHADLDEEIFMRQRKGFQDKRNPNHVCLLSKSLYGLKQSPKQWYMKFDSFFTIASFGRSEYDIFVLFI